MWRCFPVTYPMDCGVTVCSTHVEMFLLGNNPLQFSLGLLHACGDVSNTIVLPGGVLSFAPRMWRCFTRIHPRVVQAHGLLHACGDVSALPPLPSYMSWFAPRMWRCFSTCSIRTGISQVCSTHVEMFLSPFILFTSRKSLLHACGDVSAIP